MDIRLRTIVGATVLILLFAYITNQLFLMDQQSENEAFQGSWACTNDVMICPDGTEVNRTPPYCLFAACPIGATTTDQ